MTEAEVRERAAADGHRVVQDLTDAEWREATRHVWLNAYECVRPSDEFLIKVGREVLAMLDSSDLVDGLIGLPVHKHVIIRFNKS